MFPFNEILETSDFGALARLTKIPRLYRLIKLVKMLRMIKIAKQKSSFMKYLNRFVKVKAGIERIMMFMVLFVLMCHIIACFWIILINLEQEDYATWIYTKMYQDMDNFDIYVRSLYFTVTTITTVGFGDITPQTSIEMIFAVIVMICGVGVFSYATSALSTFLSTFESTTASLKEKIDTLNGLRDMYNIGPALYEELRQSIYYEAKKDVTHVIEFIDSLPNRLKLELSAKIHREIVNNIPFCKNRSNEFVSFIGPFLKPDRTLESEYIYHEGDPATKMYFIARGIVGFVLPEFRNIVYLIENT